MSSQEAVHVSLIKVTPRSGKETLGTWWFHCQRGGWTQSRPKPTHEMELSCEQTIRGRGVCVPALEPRGEREGSRTRGPSSRTPSLGPGPLRTGRDSFPSSGSSTSNACLRVTRFGNGKMQVMNPVMALGMKQDAVLGAGRTTLQSGDTIV